ncbi:MAG: hypothetical protein JWQ67_2659, partial [Marmoricola sp.]|nr:hypothetical protein [Marmoricola sp.]
MTTAETDTPTTEPRTRRESML